MAFRDYCAEITGTVPNLPFPLARTLVNRAWSDIRDLRLWSWLIGYADIYTPAAITTGTVDLVSGSTTITLSTAAAAALAPFDTADPPLASVLLGHGRQIRMGNTGSAGPIYNIVAFNNIAKTITIDRKYAGATATVQPYQVYKAYYSPPDVDFLRYFTIANMRAGYSIRGKKLYYNQPKLNAVDPQRGVNGDSYLLASFRVDANGRPVHEWYPHPTNAAVYNCMYQHRGADLSDTVDLPATFSPSLLIAKSLMHASAWAQANVSRFPDLQQTNWIMFSQDRKQEFKEVLIQAIKQDDEIFPWTAFQQSAAFDFPLGGQFVQGHDVSSLIGGI